jgi:hypothetical protein
MPVIITGGDDGVKHGSPGGATMSTPNLQLPTPKEIRSKRHGGIPCNQFGAKFFTPLFERLSLGVRG